MLPGGSETRRAASWFVLGLGVLAALALALDLVGRHARRTLPERRVEEVGSGAEALSAWARAGVHGRVLFWFGRALPTEPVSDAKVRAFLIGHVAEVPGSEESFLYLAMRANVFRRLVYVVADDRWEAFSARARAVEDARPLGRGFVQILEGVPFVSVPASDRAALRDGPPLIYLSEEARALYGDALIDGVLAGGEGADLVLVRR